MNSYKSWYSSVNVPAAIDLYNFYYVRDPKSNTTGRGDKNVFLYSQLGLVAYHDTGSWSWLDQQFDSTNPSWSFVCDQSNPSKLTILLAINPLQGPNNAHVYNIYAADPNDNPFVHLIQQPWKLGPPVFFCDKTGQLYAISLSNQTGVVPMAPDETGINKHWQDSNNQYYYPTTKSYPYPYAPNGEVCFYLYGFDDRGDTQPYTPNYGMLPLGDNTLIGLIGNKTMADAKAATTDYLIQYFDWPLNDGNRVITFGEGKKTDQGYPFNILFSDIYAAFDTFRSGSPALEFTLNIYLDAGKGQPNILLTKSFLDDNKARYSMNSATTTASTGETYNDGNGLYTADFQVDSQTEQKTLLIGLQTFFYDLYSSNIRIPFDFSNYNLATDTLNLYVKINITVWGLWTKEIFVQQPIYNLGGYFSAMTTVNQISFEHAISGSSKCGTMRRFNGNCGNTINLNTRNNWSSLAQFYNQYMNLVTEYINAVNQNTALTKESKSQINDSIQKMKGIEIPSVTLQEEGKCYLDYQKIIIGINDEAKKINDIISKQSFQIPSAYRMMNDIVRIFNNPDDGTDPTSAPSAPRATKPTATTHFPTWAYYVIFGVIGVAIIITVLVVLKKKGIIGAGVSTLG